MKKKILIILSIVIILVIGGLILYKHETTLPEPKVSEGTRGELGIDANINEKNIDNYLNRKDSVYYDMRMLVDPASYENIGGDAYLSGYVKGFEALPYPYLVNVNNLPEVVGNTYQGKTLFTKTEDGKYKANYAVSLKY